MPAASLEKMKLVSWPLDEPISCLLRMSCQVLTPLSERTAITRLVWLLAPSQTNLRTSKRTLSGRISWVTTELSTGISMPRPSLGMTL